MKVVFFGAQTALFISVYVKTMGKMLNYTAVKRVKRKIKVQIFGKLKCYLWLNS